MLALASSLALAHAQPAKALFAEGLESYRRGEYTNSAICFANAAALQPSSGVLQDLGIAQWQIGNPGPAVLAWEQARWLDPFNDAVRNNLKFARRAAQLETPELAWYEVVSTWLPVNWWAWITGISFWLAVAVATVPGLLRRRKASWHQAVAACSLAVFLLSLPAHFGVNSRAHLGFILQKNTPLRLTPTQEAQYVTRLQSGEPARIERKRGHFLLIRTSRALGWIEQEQLGLICPNLRRPRPDS